MSFHCPKCNSALKAEVEKIKDSGSFQNCGSCKKDIWIQREGFICRPYQKDGKIHCCKCLSELSDDNICISCGELFPDYILIQLSKPKVRNNETVKISFKIERKKSKDSFKTTTEKQKFNTKIIANISIILVSFIAIGFLYNFYLSNKEKNKYLENYTVALYGLKSGTDMCIKKCKSQTEEIVFTLKDGEKADLDLVKVEVDKVMNDLIKPPADFLAINDHILGLNNAYGKLYTLNIKGSGSLQNFCETAKTIEKEFDNKAKTLKSNMPDALAREIEKASLKYKKLQYML